MCVICVECDSLLEDCGDSETCYSKQKFTEVICGNCHAIEETEKEEDLFRYFGPYF